MPSLRAVGLLDFQGDLCVFLSRTYCISTKICRSVARYTKSSQYFYD